MHKSLDELNFSQIEPPTTELAALERLENSHRLIMGKRSHHIFSAVFDRILFILVGIEDIHKSLYEFEFRTDPTTDYEVSCP